MNDSLSVVDVLLSGPEEQSQIETMLAEADVFATATFEREDEASLYSLDTYLPNFTRRGPKIKALFDRNLFSPLLRIAKGEEVRSDNQTDRLAMALMAFTGAARIDIEPSLALYEVAQKAGQERACEELRFFRRAEALHPIAFQHLALSGARSIPLDVLDSVVAHNPKEVPNGTFDRRLTEWKRHRLALTKVAVVAREKPGLTGMLELLRWSEEEAYFDGVALTLAMILLSPRAKGGVLTKFLSPSPERRIDGVENAAWDLTYLTEFTKWVEKDKGLWLFCSADRRLRELTRTALGHNGGIKEILSRHWRKREAQILLAEHERANRLLRRPTEGVSHAVRLEQLEDMQFRLEVQLLEGC